VAGSSGLTRKPRAPGKPPRRARSRFSNKRTRTIELSWRLWHARKRPTAAGPEGLGIESEEDAGCDVVDVGSMPPFPPAQAPTPRVLASASRITGRFHTTAILSADPFDPLGPFG
jgi:hypothetical protein